ncbi:MAG: hypothetical protein QOK11_3787 [Pseudonocardiales bacterium]|jgi:hypothetical protein|nr:hypothetical protein [Pseudonocardiales bacterium]MDT4945321.1 hypothetical protein [Pseudonocardiales bacterium]
MTQSNIGAGVTRIGGGGQAMRRSPGPESLADVLERVLDKGVVIVGDIGVSVLDIELLTLKVRLLIASADTAREMGIDWWTGDPFYNSDARRSEEENRELRARVAELERGDGSRSAAGRSDGDGSRSAARSSSDPDRTPVPAGGDHDDS